MNGPLYIYIYFLGAWSIFSYFAAFVVQHIQRAPMPKSRLQLWQLSRRDLEDFFFFFYWEIKAFESFVFPAMRDCFVARWSFVVANLSLPSLSSPAPIPSSQQTQLFSFNYGFSSGGPVTTERWGAKHSRNTIIPARKREPSQGRCQCMGVYTLLLLLLLWECVSVQACIMYMCTSRFFGIFDICSEKTTYCGLWSS